MTPPKNLPVVLVVDDEPVVAEVFKAIFDGRFSVVSACCDTEVFDTISSVSIDLVFLDLNIAGKSGIEILRKIRKFDTHMPVVMVTGADNEDSIVESSQLGACGYISKPFDAEKVIELAYTIMRSHVKSKIKNQNFRYAVMVMVLFFTLSQRVHAENLSQDIPVAAKQGPYIELGKIIVTPRRTPEFTGEVAGNVEAISAQDIQGLPVRNIGELLGYIPGVYSEPRQEFGRPASVNIQGSDSRHVRVMIDGIPLNSQASGQVDPSMFPIEDLSRIEVIKGAASSVWGSGLGGVVNLITKDTGKSLIPEGSLTTSWAEFRTKKESLDLSGKVGQLGYYLFSSYMESGGNGPKDDVLDKKAFSKFSYDLKEAGTLCASFGFSQAEVNSGRFPDDTWQARPYRARYGKVGWEGKVAATDLKVDLKHSRQDIITLFYGSVDAPEPYFRVESRDMLYQLSLNSATPVRGEDSLVVGADFDCDTLKSTYLYKAQNVKSQAPYLNYLLKLSPWNFNFGLRYDHNSAFRGQASPAFGLVYKLKGMPDTLLRAQVSRAFNAPPLLWKYYEINLSGVTINPDMRPERAWVYETGLESRPFKNFWYKLALYRSDVRDAIAAAQNDTGDFYMKNFEKFRKQGVELQFKASLLECLDFNASGAFNDVENRVTRKTVRGGVGPRQSFNLGLEYKNKRGLNISLSGYYNRWNSPAMLEPNDRKMLCDLKVSQQIKMATLFFIIHNLNNSSYWSDYFFPLARRYFEGGMALKW